MESSVAERQRASHPSKLKVFLDKKTWKTANKVKWQTKQNVCGKQHRVDSFSLYHSKATKKTFMFENSELDTLGEHPEMQQDGVRMVSMITPAGALISDTSIFKATFIVVAS